MVIIKEIDSFKGFKCLGDVWNDVLQKSSDNDIFSTWEWLSCWWEHFGKERELRILVAEEKDHIIGIAPLMLSKYNYMPFGKISKIEFIGSPRSDYNNLFLLENKDECLKLFLKHIIK